MRRSWWVAAIATIAAIAIGCAMERDVTWRIKRNRRELAQLVGGDKRLVDAGVLLHTVVSDPNGETLVEGCPPMRVVNVQLFGGTIDTAQKRPHLCGRSEDPQIWFCSPDQERIVLHSDEDALGQLVYGSEGAGKTTAIAQWLYFRWLELLGERRRIGMFAPTLKRLGLVQDEIGKLWKESWGRYVVQRRFEGYILCDGTKILFQHTQKMSQAQGSPNQGANLSASARDEMQDQVEAHGNIQSRGRSSKRGRYKQIGTATAKDDTSWRDLRDTLVTSGKWIKRSLSIYRTPFVDPAFIELTVKGTISNREMLRRYGDPKTGEVDDLPPELAVYYGWDRKRNLVRRPHIAKDVTTAVLANFSSYLYPGRQFGLLCAHDPGVIYNTTEVLSFVMFGDVPTWMVIGEYQSKQTTARQHALELRTYLRENFYVHHPTIGGPLPILFCDPHGKGDGMTDYDTVYGAFQKEGIDVFNPAELEVRIQRRARIDMMNRLLGDSPDGVRLVIATDEIGKPVAPKLVEAFETMRKREGDDNPEGFQIKNTADKTHAPAATAYGLWSFEQESLTSNTVKTAKRAAGIRV